MSERKIIYVRSASAISSIHSSRDLSIPSILFSVWRKTRYIHRQLPTFRIVYPVSSWMDRGSEKSKQIPEWVGGHKIPRYLTARSRWLQKSCWYKAKLSHPWYRIENLLSFQELYDFIDIIRGGIAGIVFADISSGLAFDGQLFLYELCNFFNRSILWRV